MGYDAVVFDMDGVLLTGYHTPRWVYREAVADALAALGVAGEVPETLADPGDSAAFRAACADLGVDPDSVWRHRERGADERETELVARGEWTLFDDVDALDDLECVGVVSNNRQGTVSFVVDYFDSEGNRQRSERLPVVVTAARETDRFSLRAVDSDVQAADTGSVVLTFRNRGNETLTDATVSLASTGLGVRVGGGVNDTRFVGPWAPGETRTVEYRVRAGNETGDQTYAFRARVAYEDGEGDPGQSGTLQFGLRPGPERAAEFAASDVSSTLRVGAEGTLSGTITNTGEDRASNVVVVFESQTQNVSPLEREYSVGSLAPGDSATFEFDVEVSDAADDGPRQFTLRPTYRNGDDEQVEGESFDVREQIRPARDVFDVSVNGASVTQGGSTVLNVTVTNNENETLDDISGKLYADSPITVSDSDAFASELGAGESATLKFEISAGGGALAKAYPVEIDFQYDEADGDRKISDTYKLAVDVTNDDSGGGGSFPMILGAALVVVVVFGGVVAYRAFG